MVTELNLQHKNQSTLDATTSKRHLTDKQFWTTISVEFDPDDIQPRNVGAERL
jgi:hypothetical protein